ncbi:kinase-like domain-containing protein [Haematococcus lacustris]
MSPLWSVDNFVLLRKLYEGSLSVVCQARHKQSGRTVALKVYKRSRLHDMERFQLAREICLHIRLLHPNIVSLYAAWKDSKYVYLALEWVPGGNLFDLMVKRGGKLPEQEAAPIALALFKSLAYLHSHNFIHRDVKLENIVLNEQNQVKLCDFGLAIDQTFEPANTRLGTFGYFAPEISPFDYKGDYRVRGYNCKVDCWSAGVVTYELLTGRAPFGAASVAMVLEAIRTRALEFPAHLSPDASDFLTCALTRNPLDRPSAAALVEHSWFASCTQAMHT